MSRATKTLIGPDAQKAILRGVNLVYEPTRRTFGPEGKNALLFNTFGRGPRITNDGVTVAGVQDSKDPHISLVANTFIEACKKTNEKVGDGTTATTIVAGALFNIIYKNRQKLGGGLVEKSDDFGVMSMKRSLFASAEKVKKAIRKAAVKTETLEQLEDVASISVESRDLGKILAKMAWEVGPDGFIDVVEGYKGEIETEVIKGMRFPAKIPAKGFLNNPAKYEMVVLDSPVILTDYAIDNVQTLAHAVNPILEKHKKIIIIAPHFSEDVIEAMHKTMYKVLPTGQFQLTGLEIYPVKVPSLRTEQFEDIAAGLGATFFGKEAGNSWTTVTENDLGFIEKLIVKDTEVKEDALAIGKKNEKLVAERLEVLKAQLAETRQEQFKKLMERRIASLASSVGIVRVGSSTDADARYLKLKIEDAVFACKAALKAGFVPGAGQCLKTIAETLDESDPLKEALMAPYKQIMSTLGEKTKIPKNVVDPADSVYYAVEHAVSVVANLATVDIITVEAVDPIPGEGEFAIAHALNRYVILEKQKAGKLTDNEAEMELDKLSGMNFDEHAALDNKYLPQGN